MDQITKLYYNKAISLQEKYEKLTSLYTILSEDNTSKAFGEAGEDIYQLLGVGENASAEELRRAHRKLALKYHPDQLAGLPEAERAAGEVTFKKIQQAYEIASDPKSTQSMDYREGREKWKKSQPKPEPKPQAKPEPKAEPKPEPKPQAKPEPKAEPKPTPKSAPNPSAGRAPRPSEAGFDDYIKQKAEEMRKAAQGKQQAEAEAARQAAAAKKSAPPTAGSAKVTPSSGKPSIGQKSINMAKGLGRGIAGFGAGMLGYEVGRGISDTAMDVAGVENQVARDISGEAVGGAGFGTAAAAAGTALKGGGLIGLKTAGVAAGTGALAGLAAYGGYKAGEAISNIEVDEKGTTVSDVAGKGIYDIYGKMTGKGTSSEQLNTKPTGVAGGNQAKMAQNAADESEEEAQKKADMEERIARAASRRKGM